MKDYVFFISMKSLFSFSCRIMQANEDTDIEILENVWKLKKQACYTL